MAPTAVEILSESNPLLRKEITSTSEKWEKRTAKLGTIWPMGGTFDPIVCRDMEVVIRNHKANRSGKKALEKKAREELILALFEEEGDRWRSLHRVARQIINNDEKAQPLPLKAEPPPYKPSKMYPLLKGMVAIKGEVTLDEEDKQCNTQGRKGAPIHMDCYEGIRKARGGCDDAETRSSESEGEDEDSDDGHVEEEVLVKPMNRKARRKLKSQNKKQGESSRVDQGPEEPSCSTALQNPLAPETQGKPRRSHRERKAPDTLPGNFPGRTGLLSAMGVTGLGGGLI